MITSKSRRSVLHPIVAIFFFLNLEGYSVGVVLGFVGFGLPLQQAAAPPPHHIDGTKHGLCAG